MKYFKFRKIESDVKSKNIRDILSQPICPDCGAQLINTYYKLFSYCGKCKTIKFSNTDSIKIIYKLAEVDSKVLKCPCGEELYSVHRNPESNELIWVCLTCGRARYYSIPAGSTIVEPDFRAYSSLSYLFMKNNGSIVIKDNRVIGFNLDVSESFILFEDAKKINNFKELIKYGHQNYKYDKYKLPIAVVRYKIDFDTGNITDEILENITIIK